MRYIFGDIHGCALEFKELICRILQDDSKATFYSVGDVVNKGPSSLACLELIDKYKVQVIRGNHEDWLLRIWKTYLQELDEFDFSRQSCSKVASMASLEKLLFDEAFQKNFMPLSSLREKDFEFLQSFQGKLHLWIPQIETLPYWLDLGEVLVVHAGLVPGFDRLEDMPSRVLTTIRTWDGIGKNLNNFEQDQAWYELVNWPKPVVFGHWAVQGLVDLPKFKGLDTGCVYGKKLTAYAVESGEFYQIDAFEAYCPID